MIWGGGNTFKLREVSEKEIYDMTMELDCSKKTSGSITNKVLKLSVNIICPIITELINNSFRCGKFPDKLKLAEITPTPKNGDSQSANDCRPVFFLFCQLFQNCLKKPLLSSLPLILKQFFQSCFVVFVKNTPLNML